MLKINISDAPRRAFIAHASRYAVKPIRVLLQDELLLVEGLSAIQAARTLAYAAFPAREIELLLRLARKHYAKKIDSNQLERLIIIAQSLIEEDIPDQRLYQGMDRQQKLTDALTAQLCQGFIDFNGFCRFRLPGYQQYLQEMLAKAEEELIAEAEGLQYIELLRKSLSSGHGEIRLFFYPDDICHIWQRDENGLHQLEGGHIRGAEWLLLANLITLDPQQIVLQDSMFARGELLDMLYQIFAEKIKLAGHEKIFNFAIDNKIIR